LPALLRVLSAAVEEGRVPGVVAAVSTKDRMLFGAAFGLASTVPSQPMQLTSVFRIASMTKLVTSVAVMMLVEEGRADLGLPLSAYVKGFRQPEVLVDFDAAMTTWSTRPASREATLRELLSHTGGYGYWFLHEPLRLASGSDPDLVHPPFLIADPGQRFAYSTSADVIGLLVGAVSGLPLDQFFRERIFDPLGMPDTGFRRPADRSRLTHVHRRSGNGFRPLPLETVDHPVRGGGGLYSTAGDYSRLLRCLLRGGELDGVRILAPDSVAEISRNQIGDNEALMQRTAMADRSNDFIFMDGSQKFGFGVMVETQSRPGMRAKCSWSWAGVMNTYFWVDPGRDLAAVLLLQLAPFANRASVELLRQFEAAVYLEYAHGG
jgi:CubicO group peptidase (beta-lactamase class C family)